MPIHADRRIVPYTPEQMFDLVAAVDRYPEFLPWCVAARVRTRTETRIIADLVIGYKALREKFTSIIELERPGAIRVAYSEGPFRHLNNQWRFEPAPQGGCLIDFHVDFEFRSRLLQTLIQMVFSEAMRRMVGAFEGRARALYGAGETRVRTEAPSDLSVSPSEA